MVGAAGEAPRFLDALGRAARKPRGDSPDGRIRSEFAYLGNEQESGI